MKYKFSRRTSEVVTYRFSVGKSPGAALRRKGLGEKTGGTKRLINEGAEKGAARKLKKKTGSASKGR